MSVDRNNQQQANSMGAKHPDSSLLIDREPQVNGLMEIEDDPINLYIRVGTDLYQIQKVPGVKEGQYHENILKPWSATALKDDYDEETCRRIKRGLKKYGDFIYRPNHINYTREVEGYYNKYEPLPFQPSPGSTAKTVAFLNHIFGEQFEIGLDYLQLLYTKPLQPLYILCLVSNERNTGKTTFIKWLNRIFGFNFTINNIQDFDGKFNSDWTQKLIVAIEEAKSDKQSIVELLKSLSTAETFKTSAKFQDKRETALYAKYLVSSNYEEDFLPIDTDELRFWIRKIPSLIGIENPNMLEELTNEIPAFLYFLLHRKNMHTPFSKGRMWHDPKDIRTDALEKAMNGSRSIMEKELFSLLEEEYYSFKSELIKLNEEPCLRYTQSDLMKKMKDKSTIRISLVEIGKICKKVWRLEEKNSTYKKWRWDTLPSNNGATINWLNAEQATGRFFIFDDAFFKKS